MSIPPPLPEEIAPFQVPYVAAVSGHDPLTLLGRQPERLASTLTGLSDERAMHRYAPGKWSVKEVVGHLADAERIFAYRMLRIWRGDATPLPGFDENTYVEAAGFDRRPIRALVEDFSAVRTASERLFGAIEEPEWAFRGVVNGRETSLSALAYVTVGHVEHHLRILGERYGVAL